MWRDGVTLFTDLNYTESNLSVYFYLSIISRSCGTLTHLTQQPPGKGRETHGEGDSESKGEKRGKDAVDGRRETGDDIEKA